MQTAFLVEKIVSYEEDPTQASWVDFSYEASWVGSSSHEASCVGVCDITICVVNMAWRLNELQPTRLGLYKSYNSFPRCLPIP